MSKLDSELTSSTTTSSSTTTTTSNNSTTPTSSTKLTRSFRRFSFRSNSLRFKKSIKNKLQKENDDNDNTQLIRHNSISSSTSNTNKHSLSIQSLYNLNQSKKLRY